MPTDPVVLGQLAEVERLLADAADGRPQHRQLVSPRAKRLRPFLLLTCARLGGAATSPAMTRAAAGIELLHEATLYHDDIVDEALLRRGDATVQHAFGPAVAALAGSELLFATAEYFADLPLPLRRAVGRTGDALCRGQLREMETMGDLRLTVRGRERIMRDKTARLFALAAGVGASLGGAGAGGRRHAARFGLRFGLCFQLADDRADLVAGPEALGRLPGSDLYDGIYTLPVLYALASPHAAALADGLRTLQRGRDPVTLAECLRLVRDAGGVAQAGATLALWQREAAAELEQMPVAGNLPRLLDYLGATPAPDVVTHYDA
jgi:heptaprenyl diphosphate synthase